ncbi:MAG: calcium-binding protein, partial [Pseudorhodobacter sp.]
LYGGSGGDALLGGRGADQLYGSSGNDTIIGGFHGDWLDGGSGFDCASYSISLSGVTISLAAPSINTGDASGDRFYGIEGLVGSRFNDRLYGDVGDNRLEGDLGHDRLYGGAGADTLDGDAGRDTLSGGTGADTFILRRLSEGGDLVTDYDPAQADSLQLAIPDLSRSDISLRTQRVTGIGDASRAEVEIYHLGTGQVLFTLQDGAGLTDIFLRIGSTSYDLL